MMIKLMNPQEIQTIVKANLVPLKRKRMALKKNMMKQKMLTRTILMEFRLPRCRKKLECQNMTLPLQSCWVLRYHADWNLRKGKHGRKPFMIRRRDARKRVIVLLVKGWIIVVTMIKKVSLFLLSCSSGIFPVMLLSIIL
jgi:hypothetical protein